MNPITPSPAHPNVQQAYGSGATPNTTGGNQPDANPGSAESPGPSFSEFIDQAYDTAKNTLAESQQTAMAAANGDASVQKVAEAATDAQLTVETITALRDKAIQSYKSIQRMPI